MNIGEVYLHNGVKMIVRDIVGNLEIVDQYDRPKPPIKETYKQLLQNKELYSIERNELEIILDVLDKVDWCIQYAANVLDIQRQTIYAILKRNGIEYSGNADLGDIQPAQSVKPRLKISGKPNASESEDCRRA